LFGLTGLGGRVGEAIGVAVHVAGVQVPVQGKSRGDAGVPHELLEHLGGIPGLDRQRGGHVSKIGCGLTFW